MEEREPQPSAQPGVVLRGMIDGFWISQAIYVAAKLGLADRLKDGPKHYEALATASGAHPQALYRLLRALASVGVFTRLDDDHFALSPLADTLRSDAPGSLRAWAIVSGEQMYPAWGHLLHSVQTGQTAFDDLHRMGVWQYRAQNPEAHEVANAAMSDAAVLMAQAAIEVYDFCRFSRVVDVGGGQGVFLQAILAACPHVEGVLFEMPEVIHSARASMQAEGLLDRCQLVAGDFVHSIPAGGDAYLLARILHDWDDEAAARILASCRRAMNAGQKLLILERLIDADHPAAGPTLYDLNMMVMTGGRERTAGEYNTLLAATGFEMRQVLSTRSPLHIIEADAI